jgi:uncharacterized membrane protein (UPF0127 family)
MKKYIALLLVVFLVLVNGCSNGEYVEVGGDRIDVEVAKTDSQISTGLMFREELCDNCGMLFVFPEEDLHGFWMKDTLIPLDIVFISSDLVVVDMFHALPCVEEVCNVYVPKEGALYVLETNMGKFNEGVVGEKVELAIQ